MSQFLLENWHDLHICIIISLNNGVRADFPKHVEDPTSCVCVLVLTL